MVERTNEASRLPPTIWSFPFDPHASVGWWMRMCPFMRACVASLKTDPLVIPSAFISRASSHTKEDNNLLSKSREYGGHDTTETCQRSEFRDRSHFKLENHFKRRFKKRNSVNDGVSKKRNSVKVQKKTPLFTEFQNTKLRK